jgi:xylulokinase
MQPMRDRTLLGIDVSTTGVKALLVDERGRVIASETTGLALSTPRPLWAEQQPEDWWQATSASLRRLLARPGIDAAAIAAIGLTGQMHGLVLLDERGRALRPAILWNDQRAGAVGVGAVEPGIVAAVLGTSGVVFATTDGPVIEPEGRLHAFCHAVPGRWHLMGVMLSAAGSLQWYRDALAPSVSFDALAGEATQVPAGADGLVFLPYLTGERTPHPDPLARGAFVGLTRRHQRAHLTRAVLEGVAFGLRECFDLIATYAASPKSDVRRPESEPGAPEARSRTPGIASVRLTGGGAKSALWRRILASVLEVRVEQVNSTEGAAFGAALLAGVGAGVWPDVASACGQTIAVTSADEPVGEWRERYARMHEIYKAMYPALKPTFARLAVGS